MTSNLLGKGILVFILGCGLFFMAHSLYPEVIRLSVGEIIKKLRIDRGETQEQLAAAIGIERSSVGKYEGKSQVMPSHDVLFRLAEHFGVSVDYLLEHTVHTAVPTTQEESRLLILWRNAEPDARRFALEMLELHQIEAAAGAS